MLQRYSRPARRLCTLSESCDLTASPSRHPCGRKNDHSCILDVCIPSLEGVYPGTQPGQDRETSGQAKAKRVSPYKRASAAEQLAVPADDSLFRAIISNQSHVLRRFLPESRSHSYNLRTRAHEYKLPPKDNRHFISRLLYKNIY